MPLPRLLSFDLQFHSIYLRLRPVKGGMGKKQIYPLYAPRPRQYSPRLCPNRWAETGICPAVRHTISSSWSVWSEVWSWGELIQNQLVSCQPNSSAGLFYQHLQDKECSQYFIINNYSMTFLIMGMGASLHDIQCYFECICTEQESCLILGFFLGKQYKDRRIIINLKGLFSKLVFFPIK